MFKREFVLLVLIFLLLFVIVFLFKQNQDYVNVARFVSNEWNERDEYLINICNIDYNLYLEMQRNYRIEKINSALKKLNDYGFDFYVNKKNYFNYDFIPYAVKDFNSVDKNIKFEIIK